MKKGKLTKLNSILIALTLILFTCCIKHADASGWMPMTIDTTEDLNDIWGSSASDVFVVGDNGTIFQYNGIGWTSMDSGTSKGLECVWGSSGSDVFAAGSYGTILHYDGSSWSAMTSGTTEALKGVWGSAGSDVFAVGVDGTILHYNTIGWSQMDYSSYDDIYSIWGSSGSDVFAVNSYSRILHYDGTNWSETDSTWGTLYDIWGSSSMAVLAVGSSGTVLQYNGSTWSSTDAGSSNTLYGVWGSSLTDIYAVGSYGTILYYDGSTWYTMTSGITEYLNDIWGSSSSDVYAVGDNGTILHYSGPDSVTTTTTDPTTTSISDDTTTTVTDSDTTTTTTVDPDVTTTTAPSTSITVDFMGSPTVGSAPLTVSFTNLSQGNISSYMWNFGDGGTSTEQHPTHIYTKMGNFSVILTANGADGSSKQEIKTNYIATIPGCPFIGSLDNQEDIKVLRTLRDSMLDNLFGLILTCIYYQNSDEIASILSENAGLQHDLRDLVGENINVAGDLINGKGSSISKDNVNDVIEFLNELKREGSPRLRADIRIVIDAIRVGYFLYGLGVEVD